MCHRLSSLQKRRKSNAEQAHSLTTLTLNAQELLLIIQQTETSPLEQTQERSISELVSITLIALSRHLRTQNNGLKSCATLLMVPNSQLVLMTTTSISTTQRVTIYLAHARLINPSLSVWIGLLIRSIFDHAAVLTNCSSSVLVAAPKRRVAHLT